MFSGLRIKLLQDKMVNLCDTRENIECAIEELNELIEELEIFMAVCEQKITRHDLQRACGNMQKEIEDVAAITVKLRKLFVRTYNQRRESWRARRKIVKQLRGHLEKKGLM